MWLSNPIQAIKRLLQADFFQREIFTIHAKAISLEEAPAKFIVLNKQNRVVFWNSRDKASIGYSEEEVIGKVPDFIFPNGYRMIFNGLLNQWKIEGSMDERNLEMNVVTKQGKRFPVEAIFVSKKILDEDYLLIILRNITATKEKEKKYEQELEIYKHGEKAGNFGSWYWDIIENHVYTSEGFRRIFSVNDSVQSSDYFIKRVHPEDRTMVQECIKAGFESASDYQINRYRIVGEDLSWKYVSTVAEAKYNQGGKLIGFLGFVKFLDNNNGQNNNAAV